MFDLGFGELLLIGIVALIVVGPKDLPILFHKVGNFMGKARGMAREFSRAMDTAAKESGMSDIQKTLRAAADPKSFGTDALKKATGLKPDPGAPKPAAKQGPETEALSKDRAEFKAKMDEKAAAMVAERNKAREAAAEAATTVAEAPAAPTPDPAAPKADKPAGEA